MNKIRNPRFFIVCLLVLFVAAAAIGLSGLTKTSTTLASPYNQGHPKWEVASIPDSAQWSDLSVPVAVFSIASGETDSVEGGPREHQVKEVIVENRSPRDVSKVTLRWLITPLNARKTVLQRGELETHVLRSFHKTLIAGHRQTLRFSSFKIGQLIKAFPDADATRRSLS